MSHAAPAIYRAAMSVSKVDTSIRQHADVLCKLTQLATF